MLRGDSRTGIAHEELDAFFTIIGADDDRRSWRAVLHGVRNQVGEHLVYRFGIGLDHGIVIQLNREFASLQVRHLRKILLRFAHELRCRNLLRAKSLLARLYARERQQIFGEPRHSRRVLADDLQKLARSALYIEVKKSLGVSLN